MKSNFWKKTNFLILNLIFTFWGHFNAQSQTSTLKVMAWNIAEGREAIQQQHHSSIPAIAAQISWKNPDIVLLNEVLNRTAIFGDGVNQIRSLQRITGFPFYGWGNTVATGWTGWKAVGILSRFPILAETYMPIIGNNGNITGYGMYVATLNINNATHYIVSLRFDAHNVNDNIAAHQQAANFINGLPLNATVVIGGDFNAEGISAQFLDFVSNSGLTNIYVELPDPNACSSDIDNILYRGPYEAKVVERRCPWATPSVSDHPWVFVELESDASPQTCIGNDGTSVNLGATENLPCPTGCGSEQTRTCILVEGKAQWSPLVGCKAMANAGEKCWDTRTGEDEKCCPEGFHCERRPTTRPPCNRPWWCFLALWIPDECHCDPSLISTEFICIPD